MPLTVSPRKRIVNPLTSKIKPNLKRRGKINNPIIQQKIYEGLLEGKTDKDVLIGAGFSLNGADKNAKHNKALQMGKQRVEQELIKSKITVEYVLMELERAKELCIKGKKKDYSSFVRATELLGKHLKMWADNTNVLILVNDKGNQFTLTDRVKKLKNEG